MKRKVVSILSIFLTLMLLYAGNVKAESGKYAKEIDPKDYITLPINISIKNKIGTGKITVSQEGYTIYYQKVDITSSELQTLDSKASTANAYTTQAKGEIEAKQAKVDAAQAAYDAIKNQDDQTEQKQQKQQELETANQELQTLKQQKEEEYNRLVDDYYTELKKHDYSESNWETAVENSGNNVSLDFTGVTDNANFILWVKATKSSETIYDVGYYSTKIEDTEESSDFSSATYTLKKEGKSDVAVEISGVSYQSEKNYYAYISSTSETPDVSSLKSNDLLSVAYDEEKNVYRTLINDITRELFEKNGDIYISILEDSASSYKVLNSAKKLTKFTESKNPDAFFATFVSNRATQIVMNWVHSNTNDRKLQIKVGKITDLKLLNKIKEDSNTGFAELLNFVKNNSGDFSKTVSANKNDSYAIEYTAGTAYDSSSTSNNEILNISNVEDDAYYYLYVQADGEDGKYVVNEAVTLAKAYSDNSGSWSMIFYGADDFDWDNLKAVDDSTIDKPLPQTGIASTVFAVAILAVVVGIISYKKAKKYSI